jgi:hypothetical protein
MSLHQNKDQIHAGSTAVFPKEALQGRGLPAQITKWMQPHPVLAILLVSLLAVCVNCYPVIFCGRSYVCPICTGGGEVYSWLPPLPQMADTPKMSSHGSDTIAALWWEVPAGFIESRSLLEQGEIPLWNRYGHAGDAFIGQAETMLGDPLQLIVIAGRGSAGAWDIKFLAAKFTFCAGFGVLILRLLKSLPLALMFAALAAYCGAFFYINNHPVFFVFCYAPWILLTALAWLDLRSEQHLRWGLAWLLVNFACFNAGHVEVAVVLIGGLNLAALAHALVGLPTLASWARVTNRIGLGTLLFLGLTAPVWMSFLTAEASAYSLHSQVRIFQFPPAALPGMFDDLFYLLMRPDVHWKASAPGSSLCVLIGCLCAVWNWRQWQAEPFFWINSSAIVFWAGGVFGWVPAFIIAAIPLLNRVGHTHTDFSYLLIIHLTVQAAYGYRSLAQETDLRRAGCFFYTVALVFAVGVCVYGQFIAKQAVPWFYFCCTGAGALGAPLLYLYLKIHPRQISAVGWVGIIVLGFIPNFRFGLYSFGGDALLMLPGPRAVLNAPSLAIEKIKAGEFDPIRVVGLDWTLMGDYEAVYGLEGIGSLAPLSNNEFINLVKTFPGVSFTRQWRIEITNYPAAQPLLNLLNVKYLLADPRDQVVENSGFRIAGRSDFLVLVNEKVWPRSFFSNRIVTNSSNDQFMQQLLTNGQAPFVSLSPDEIKRHSGLAALVDLQPSTVVPAKRYQLLPNSTAFDIRAPSAGVVCLTEGQANDFTATANDEKKDVLTVNRAFKGIYLDKPGDYHVQFTYRPHSWRLASDCFWLSTGVVLLLGLRSLGEKTKRKPTAIT